MLQVDTKSDAYLKCQRVSVLTPCGGLTRILKSRVLLLECNPLRLLWNCGQSRMTPRSLLVLSNTNNLGKGSWRCGR